MRRSGGSSASASRIGRDSSGSSRVWPARCPRSGRRARRRRRSAAALRARPRCGCADRARRAGAPRRARSARRTAPDSRAARSPGRLRALADSSSKAAASASPASPAKQSVAPRASPATASSAARCASTSSASGTRPSASASASSGASAVSQPLGEIVARLPSCVRAESARPRRSARSPASSPASAPRMAHVASAWRSAASAGLQARAAQHRAFQRARRTRAPRGATCRTPRADASAAPAASRRARRRAPSPRRAAPARPAACGRAAGRRNRRPSIPQRFSSTATRRASPRSGVTSAATWPGVSAACAQERPRPPAPPRARSPPRRSPHARQAPRPFSVADSAASLAPALGRARRAHRFGYEAARARERRWRSPSGSTSLAPHAEPLEQQLQAVLRMAGAGRLALARSDRRPAVRVEILVEAGQHDGAVRQPRDRGEQRRGRRHRAGRARGDHRRRRALREQAAPPRARISRSRRVAGIEQPALAPRCAGQNSRGDPQEFQRDLPVAGEVGGHAREAARARRPARCRPGR